MGVSGERNFVLTREPTTIEHMVDHIDHVSKLVSIEHVGSGSDSDLNGYDHMPPEQLQALRASYRSSCAFHSRIDSDDFDHARRSSISPQRWFIVVMRFKSETLNLGAATWSGATLPSARKCPPAWPFGLRRTAFI
jgi:hypothetical protein